ncbi:MAG TPA: hypothetical protein VG895_00965 [Patescibacteria group bacterium]|nr:hypothetical protein [Patescibacteria group bacterium]
MTESEREFITFESQARVKFDMEVILFPLLNSENRFLDLEQAFLLLQENKIYISSDSIKIIRADIHPVGEIASKWIIDPSRQPFKRVYKSRKDYEEKSGVVFQRWNELINYFN